MKKINSKDLLDELISDTRKVINVVEHKFKPLGEEELNFKSGGWSISECMEHLNIADDHYMDLFEERLSTAKRIDAGSDFKPGILGNYFSKSMKPKPDGTIPSKMKTFSKFEPNQENLSTSIEVFLKDQYRLLELLDQSRYVDLNKLKIHSAIGKIINFKMGDAFRFVIAHNQRHVVQAENVLKAISLPVTQ